MDLKGDWRTVFSKSTTPVGLHAREQWLGDGSKARRAASAKAADRLRRGQRKDGSWAGSECATIERLWHLYLVGAKADESARAALDFLLEKAHPPLVLSRPDGAPYDNLFFRMEKYESAKLLKLRGTPCTPGCSGFVKSGVALMLASLFWFSEDERVEKAFRSFDEVNRVRKGRWCTPSCGANVLQGYSVHASKSKGAAMRRSLAWYAAHQTKSGAWDKAPFLHTVQAISRVDLPAARRILNSALPGLLRRQNRDGTWGRVNPEWQTFQAVDTLRNLGELT